MDFSRLSRNPSIFSRLMIEYKKDFAGWGERAPALSLAAPVCGAQGEREPAGEHLWQKGVYQDDVAGGRRIAGPAGPKAG